MGSKYCVNSEKKNVSIHQLSYLLLLLFLFMYIHHHCVWEFGFVFQSLFGYAVTISRANFMLFGCIYSFVELLAVSGLSAVHTVC